MIAPSIRSQRTKNPIRALVGSINPPKDHPDPFLNLALGDPTAHGNMAPPTILVEAVQDALTAGNSNGYVPSIGAPAARAAVARFSSLEGFPVDEDDVIVASGCSGSIDLVLSALLDEGDNILVPMPNFPLYQVVSESLGAEVRMYPLIAEENWSCDLEQMDALVDSRTKAILINNPSNPCGSNFSAEHLRGIAAVARKHNIMIVADEIYSGLVFKGSFEPMHVHSGDVPVISLGGLAKEFVVPGWRVGWLVLHDKGTGRLAELKTGIRSLTQIILGATSLIQGAIPRLLCPPPGSADESSLLSFTKEIKNTLRENVALVLKTLSENPVVEPIEPQGAMYVLLRINVHLLRDIKDDTVFARMLLTEENLFILPGQCFSIENFVRLVICCPPEMVVQACQRINDFCRRHAQAL